MGKLYSSLRNIFFQDSRKEAFLYLALWLLLFLMPLFSISVRLSNAGSTATFPWGELLLVWRQFGIFLLMFLIHNFLLAPLLVYRQRRALYFSSLAVLLTVFLLLQCNVRPHMDRGPLPPKVGHTLGKRPPHMADGKHFDKPGEHRDGFAPPAPPDFHDFHNPRHPDDRHGPPVIIGEHDMVACIIFILMIGMNLGVKLYFRQQKDRHRMMELENENLEQQLQYLKYQINPHFLMNTLNNIHALVDIDPEQAKETIVELSKIMRFVLYEGSKQKVPLRQELMFLENYIELMRMRYSDQVAISVTLPDIIPNRDIPPLLLITFVENAFKHGASYQQQSFIHIDISIASPPMQEESPNLHFRCTNSKKPQAEDTHGGVGLQNACRRLELLYGKAYNLDINDGKDTYSVNLTLPL